MATTSMDYEVANGDRFDDEAPRTYEDGRRSASPRQDDVPERRRSASPSNGDRANSKDESGSKDGDGTVNPGSNLFVTGIHPRLTESEVSRLFEKYGEVEKCQIMRDPHTKESRGFGFVKMVTSEQADAARESLQGHDLEGRSLSIEKARRARPRTPTPGKYFGPPKREPRGGRYEAGRFDGGRRGGGYGAGRDDPYRYRGYERRYDERDRDVRGHRDDRPHDRNGGGYREDRGYDRRDRDDFRADRYGSRDDRYGPPRDDRRGPMDRERERDRDRYERGGDREGPRSRDPRDAPGGGYGDGSSRGEGREPYGGSDRGGR